MFHHHLRRHFPLEGDGAGQHLVKNDPHRIDIRAPIGDAVASGLRGHVGRRPDHHPAARRRLVQVLGGAEVQDGDEVEGPLRLGQRATPAVQGAHDLPPADPPFQHDVVRLQVVMDDPLVVGGGQGPGELAQDHQGAEQRQPILVAQHPVQGHAVHVVHHQEDGPVLGLTEVGDPDDVRVVDDPRRLGLAQEPRPGLGLIEVRPVQHLHRHRAAQVGVFAAVHHPHSTPAEDAV
jgi:hypothetical protein